MSIEVSGAPLRLGGSRSGIRFLGGAAAAPAAGYSDEVLADNPVAYWRLGEAAGSTAVDDAGANDGTYVGGVTLGATGAVAGDTAITLDGTGRVTVPHHASLNVTTSYTFEAWVKVAAYSSYVIFEKAEGNPGYLWRLSATGEMQVQMQNGTGQASTTPIGTGAWHHVAVSYDGANLAFYLDGEPDGTPGTTLIPVPGSGGLTIGRYSWGGGSLVGSLDEVAIYNTVLTPERIAAHFEAAA